jgi:hypothetical protein
MRRKALALIGIAAIIATPAVAHHSFAMFDATRIVTLDGAVKEFKWTNPHAFIILTVDDAKGEPAQWAIEMNGPAGIAREGWKPRTLTPGMKVQVTIHPLLDGNNGGQYLAVKLPNGTQMGHPEGRVIGAGVRGSDVQ